MVLFSPLWDWSTVEEVAHQLSLDNPDVIFYVFDYFTGGFAITDITIDDAASYHFNGRSLFKPSQWPC